MYTFTSSFSDYHAKALTTLSWICTNYYVRHKVETHENRRFFRTGMELAENAYAYVLKAPSRS